MKLNKRSKDYRDGLQAGFLHNSVEPKIPIHLKLENERKVKEGLADDRERIFHYWAGYAKAAGLPNVDENGVEHFIG